MTPTVQAEPLVERLTSDRPTEASFWSAEPPGWAKDPFNGDRAEQCGRCGAWCDVVRPGKTQCSACGDRDEPALRWEAAAAITALQQEVEGLTQDVADVMADLHKTALDYDDAMDRAEAAEALVARLREALESLTNSADGLSFREEGIRNIVGNTNWRVLRVHVEAARTALRETGPASKESGT